jgi:hypothetical protein
VKPGREVAPDRSPMQLASIEPPFDQMARDNPIELEPPC